MLTWPDYVWYKENFGSVSSFALYGDNGEPPRVSAEEEFYDLKLDLKLSPEVNGYTPVFFALNFSGTKGTTEEAFDSFHMTYNDSKLGALIDEVPELEGAYITDLFKELPDSNSGGIMKRWKNKEIFVDPDALYNELIHMLMYGGELFPILLGTDADKVFQNDVGPIGVRIPHYSAQGNLGSKVAYVDKASTMLKNSPLFN